MNNFISRVQKYHMPKSGLTGCILSFLTCVFLFAFANPIIADQQKAQTPEIIFLENDLLRIGVDAHTGSIAELTEKSTLHDHIARSSQHPFLWTIEWMQNGQTFQMKPSDAKTYTYRYLANRSHTLQMTWSDFAPPLNPAGRVIATLVIKKNQSLWSLEVQGFGEPAVHEIAYPRIGPIRKQSEERIAVPDWMGRLIRNPREHLKDRRWTWDYPGWMSMQCMAYYQENGPGLFLASHDSTVARKTFVVSGTRNGTMNLEMHHYAADLSEGPGQYRSLYPVVLGAFQGDWITAAQHYREWATRQHWARNSRLSHAKVPDWIQNMGLWIWNRGRSAGVLSPAAVLQEELGLPVGVFWHWWHGCSYDVGFPEYFPPREGTVPFKKAIQQAHEHGTRMLIYMNSRAWGTSTDSWETENAARYALKKANGEIDQHVYNIFTGKALATMCMATPFWRNTYAGLAEHAFGELGVDGIYMDQACSDKQCFDPEHDHPPGGGDSWIRGFYRLTRDIRNRCNNHRQIVLAGEGSGESWMPYLDLMLTLQFSRERYTGIDSPWKVIPFFQAVYHPYAITFGSYSSLTMPPYDDLWPDEFAPEEPLTLLDQKYSQQYYLEQARAFVWGHQITLANFRPVLLQQRADEIGYLMNLARIRNRALKYLLHGIFLRPPDLDAPEAVLDFSRLSIYAGQTSRLKSFQQEHPLALAGAWRARDGDVAIALASIADHPLTLHLKLDEYYQLPQSHNVYRIDAAGRHPFEVKAGKNAEFSVELPAHGACMIEFTQNAGKTSGPDRD